MAPGEMCQMYRIGAGSLASAARNGNRDSVKIIQASESALYVKIIYLRKFYIFLKNRKYLWVYLSALK